MKVTLYTDGGARGNPGPAAAGVHILMDKKEYVFGYDLGELTNNQAEYLACYLGLKAIGQVVDLAQVETVDAYLDSELTVKQLNGEYRVKNPELLKLNESIKRLIKDFPVIQFHYIARENNPIADRAVNQTLDNIDGIKTLLELSKKAA